VSATGQGDSLATVGDCSEEQAAVCLSMGPIVHPTRRLLQILRHVKCCGTLVYTTNVRSLPRVLASGVTALCDDAPDSRYKAGEVSGLREGMARYG
jgi:hypothetical protein